MGGVTREAGEASYTSDRIFSSPETSFRYVNERQSEEYWTSKTACATARSETNRRPEAALCSQRISDRTTFIGHSQT